MDAFFYPASSAIVPQIVELDDLQAANSLNQTTAQFSVILGPMTAGATIALLGGGAEAAGIPGVPDLKGIGIAFAVDAISFLCSATTLWLVRLKTRDAQPSARERRNFWLDIREGLMSVWKDPALRITMLLCALMNSCAYGPNTVGIPVLASARFSEGALALGVFMSAYGGGWLLGTVTAGIAPKPSPRRFGPTVVLLFGTMGIGLVLFEFVPTVAPAAVIAVAIGAAGGYSGILLLSWVQRRTPPAMLGRTMGVLMVAVGGLVPISTALAGAVLSLDLTALFAGAGSLLVVASLLGAIHPAIRAMGIETNRSRQQEVIDGAD